jgi:hypothetical protein
MTCSSPECNDSSTSVLTIWFVSHHYMNMVHISTKSPHHTVINHGCGLSLKKSHSFISMSIFNPSHLISLQFMLLITFCNEYKTWSSSLWNSHQPPVTISPFGQNVFLSTLFSDNLKVHSSLVVRDQLSSPSKISHTVDLCAFNPYILTGDGKKNSVMNVTS